MKAVAERGEVVRGPRVRVLVSQRCPERITVQRQSQNTVSERYWPVTRHMVFKLPTSVKRVDPDRPRKQLRCCEVASWKTNMPYDDSLAYPAGRRWATDVVCFKSGGGDCSCGFFFSS